MGDDIDRIDQHDRETALAYQDMYQFLKEEHREVKVKDHRYTLRATAGGRVRGTSVLIFSLVPLAHRPLS